MNHTYLCPSCQGTLNPGTKVIFVAEHDSASALVLLSPDLGDYAAILGAGVPMVEGVAYLFRCPMCHADLTSLVNENLVEILLSDEHGRQAKVAFSRVCGEHATLVQADRGVRRFGEHADRYATINFFGAGDDNAGG